METRTLGRQTILPLQPSRSLALLALLSALWFGIVGALYRKMAGLARWARERSGPRVSPELAAETDSELRTWPWFWPTRATTRSHALASWARAVRGSAASEAAAWRSVRRFIGLQPSPGLGKLVRRKRSHARSLRIARWPRSTFAEAATV